MATKFVQSRHPAAAHGSREDNAPNVNDGYDDCRVPVQKTGVGQVAPNTAQTRSRDRTHEHYGQQQHLNGPASKSLFETDDSSIGDDSEDLSRTHSRDGSAQAPLACHVRGLDRGEHTTSRGTNGKLPPRNGEVELYPRQQPTMHFHALGGSLSEGALTILARNGDAAGIQSSYVEGDSYPPTTSGGPSSGIAAEIRDEDDAFQPLEEGSHEVVQTKPLRTSTNGMIAADHKRSTESKPVKDRGFKTMQDGYVVRPHEGVPIPELTYGRPNNVQMTKHSAAKPVQQTHSSTTTSKPTPASNIARRATEPTIESGTILASRSKQNTTGFPHEYGTAEQSQPTAISTPRNQKQIPPQQQNASAPRKEPDAWSGRIRNPDSRVDADQTTHQVGETNEQHLDYVPRELFKMNYQDLKALPFDKVPDENAFSFPEGQMPANLNDKLASAANLDQRDQLHFFSSLPIQDWEACGDWFITQFSEVLSKMKGIRQRKRSAAKVFESEIEKRHVAVSRKRKQMEDELSEMKESGDKVLQGTPKKTKSK